MDRNQGICEVTEPAKAAPKRPPGRPRGYPKSGGRKARDPGADAAALAPAELRKFVSRSGRPLELLAAIASGRKVTAADPASPGAKSRVYPTLAERLAAARVLAAKVLPDLRAMELTGKDGGPLAVDEPELPAKEIARRIAFLLAEPPPRGRHCRSRPFTGRRKPAPPRRAFSTSAARRCWAGFSAQPPG